MIVKKLFLLIVLMLVGSIVVSCSQKQNKAKEGTVPEMVEVNLTVNPEKGDINTPIVFEAKVTQGKEAVNDAEVTFEVWHSQDDQHEKIDIKQAENGVYRLEKSFQQEGTYYIISHVTARDMHNMPKKEFVIGSPSEPESTNTNDTMDDMDMDE